MSQDKGIDMRAADPEDNTGSGASSGSPISDILKQHGDFIETLTRDGRGYKGLSDEQAEQAILQVIAEAIGEDFNLVDLADMPNIQLQARGRNIEKASIRAKLRITGEVDNG